MSWEKAKMCDVMSGFFDGPHATPKPSDEGAVFLGIKNISEDGRLDLSNTKKISLEEYPKWTKRVVPEENDIVFSYEATLHRYAIIPNDFFGCLGRRMALIRTNDKIYFKYLYYYFFSKDWRDEVSNHIINGSTVDRIPLTSFPNFNISIPPLPTQKKIANILSKYDDSIENNLKRIKLLEEAAQNIYKEWFVNFRFPNHENTPINEETGLPEGWLAKPISEVASFLGGFAFKSKSYVENGKYKVVTIKNVGDRVFDTTTINFVDEIPEKMKGHCKIEEGQILLSLTGNVGRTCLAYGKDNLLNQRVAIVKGRTPEIESFLYFLFNNESMKILMNNISSGVAQQNLSPVNLSKQIITTPPNELLMKFSGIADKVCSQIIGLLKYNWQLKQARDILLPRLMNQSIEI